MTDRLAGLVLALLLSADAGAALISTTSSAASGGVSWGSGDVVDLAAGALVFDDRALFDGSENVDAWSAYGSRWVLSSSTDSTIGGTAYRDGDLIVWNPLTGEAGLFLSEDAFGGADEDIDAVHVFADGTLALSTTSSATLGGLRFASGDVVRYDPAADSAAMLFDGSDWFDASENIDALAVIGDDLLISSSTDGTAGALAFTDGDILRFDGAGLTLWLSESVFAADEDIDALAVIDVPAPPVAALLCIGLPVFRRRALAALLAFSAPVAATPLDEAVSLVLNASPVVLAAQDEADEAARQPSWTSRVKLGYQQQGTDTDAGGWNAGVYVDIPLFGRKHQLEAVKARHQAAEARDRVLSAFLADVATLTELEAKRAEGEEMAAFYRDRLEYFKQAEAEGRVEPDTLWTDAEKAKKAEHDAAQGAVKLSAALEETARRFGGGEWKRLRALLADHVR